MLNARATRLAAAVSVAGAVALAPSIASAHVERSSYWPDPAPDTSVTPATGGKVPKARSLASALLAKPPGTTRVVCRGNSLSRLAASVRRGINRGYKDRPTQRRRHLSAAQARRLLRINRVLKRRCKFHSIQDAVNASGNNDRVVIMPGVYTEPKSRSAPTNDPACASLTEENDNGNTSALAYEYQLQCPNDQSLVAVLGRELGPGMVPQPPLGDRHGIPNEGACIRCNLQIEGSGVSADDVAVDAGRAKSGNHGPADPVKDVVFRVDRADGFVLRNLTVRHAREHGIYVLESDGYLLDRFKAFYNEDYGVLTFVEDHGVMRNCEAKGSGDSGLYPGAGADTGEQVVAPDTFRYAQRITRCDSHHNASGYSGTDGNSVHVDHNNFYDNALGFTTDVFTAAGHPGFPQDSDLVENNNFYSNNFNVYGPNSDIDPTVPVPVGTGLWIAGGNNNVLRNNHFYDNWRRGVMLFGVPDNLICPDGPDDPVYGCDPAETNTSHRNEFRNNVMGRTPGGRVKPNGKDFWWDNVIGQLNNCWIGNKGKTGTAASLTSLPDPLPSDCATSDGADVEFTNAQQGELLACVYDLPSCTWFQQPPRP
jgi:parallel beta-helix repeat protein